MSADEVETLTTELDALRARLRALPTTAAAAVQALDNPQGPAEFVKVHIARLALPAKIDALEQRLAAVVRTRLEDELHGAYVRACAHVASLEARLIPMVHDYGRTDASYSSFQTLPAAKEGLKASLRRQLPPLTALRGEVTEAKRVRATIAARAKNELGADDRQIRAWAAEADLLAQPEGWRPPGAVKA